MHYDTLEEATTAIFLLPDKQFLKIFHPAISKGGPLQPFLMDELRILTAEAITEEYYSGTECRLEERRAVLAAAGEE